MRPFERESQHGVLPSKIGTLDTMTTTTAEDIITTVRSQMYGDTILTTRQWKILGEILMRQTYAMEDGERVWRVAGLQVDTGTLQDAVRACQRRAGEAVGDVRLRGRETEGGE